MRDQLKSVEYFNEFIEEDLKRVIKFSEKLKNGEVKEERIFDVKAKVHDLKLGILVAQYSRGDSLVELKEAYVTLLKEWNEVWEADFYNKNLKMISLAVLFGVDKVYATTIKQQLKELNINDWLLEYLINSIDNRIVPEHEKLLFPESFFTLRNVVYNDNKADLMNKYLSKEWYNDDCGCYNAHKSKQRIYYGYWSFEAGAIAKILKLDDSLYANNMFYPYDLVHFK